MSDEVVTRVPAAWYPDPEQPSRLRWWDGSAWTLETQELPPPPVVHAESDAAGPAWTQQPQPTHLSPVDGGHDAEAPFVVRVEPEPEPEHHEYAQSAATRPPDRVIAEARRRAARGGVAGPVYRPHDDSRPASERDDNDDVDKDDFVGSVVTVETWIMTFLPLVALLAVVLLTQLPKAPHSYLVAIVIVAAALILSVILASFDRGTLRARNRPVTVPPALGLLPPIFLLVRGVRVSAVSLVQLVLWVGFAVVAVGVIAQVGAYGWVFSLVDRTAGQ